MKISTKSRYAVRIMINLAEQYTLNHIPAGVIAEAENLPVKYMESILSSLLKNQLIIAARGTHGGYKLALPPEQINVLQIIRASETSTQVAPCVDENYPCPNKARCVSTDLWNLVQSTIDELLVNITLVDLLRMQEKKTDEPSLYLMHLAKLQKLHKNMKA